MAKCSELLPALQLKHSWNNEACSSNDTVIKKNAWKQHSKVKRGSVCADKRIMCGDSSVYGAFYCSSDHGAGDLSRCGLKLTETFRQHVRWLFLFRPHIHFSMLSSPPGPVITERLKQHVLLLLPLGATPRPQTHTDPHMDTKRRLQLPTNGTLTSNCYHKASKNRRTVTDCSSCLNFFLIFCHSLNWGWQKKDDYSKTRELLVKCKWNRLRKM